MTNLAFTIKRGETRRWTLELTNDDGTPIAGTLSNPRSEWRAGRTDTDPIVAVFNTSTPCDVNGQISVSTNVITMVLDNSMTKLMTPAKYNFDVFVDIDGEPICIGSGIASVTQNITVPE